MYVKGEHSEPISLSSGEDAAIAAGDAWIVASCLKKYGFVRGIIRQLNLE